MDIFREVVALLVAAIGLVGWIVFLPQIRLLYEMKRAESVSLLFVWGSLAMQAVILVHILLQTYIDWRALCRIFHQYHLPSRPSVPRLLLQTVAWRPQRRKEIQKRLRNDFLAAFFFYFFT